MTLPTKVIFCSFLITTFSLYPCEPHYEYLQKLQQKKLRQQRNPQQRGENDSRKRKGIITSYQEVIRKNKNTSHQLELQLNNALDKQREEWKQIANQTNKQLAEEARQKAEDHLNNGLEEADPTLWHKAQQDKILKRILLEKITERALTNLKKERDLAKDLYRNASYVIKETPEQYTINMKNGKETYKIVEMPIEDASSPNENAEKEEDLFIKQRFVRNDELFNPERNYDPEVSFISDELIPAIKNDIRATIIQEIFKYFRKFNRIPESYQGFLIALLYDFPTIHQNRNYLENEILSIQLQQIALIKEENKRINLENEIQKETDPDRKKTLEKDYLEYLQASLPKRESHEKATI